MDFGVIFLSHVESYKDVALAESQGFSHAWFGDSQMVWAAGRLGVQHLCLVGD